MMTLLLGLHALVPVQDGSIWDRLTLYANGRLRGEATFDNVDATTGNDIDDRFRGRMRFRVGGKYVLTEEVNLEGRISTSSDGNDANNPHWDFGDGDGFNSSQVVLDRFFLDWNAGNDIHVLAGKQPHAFAMPPGQGSLFGEFMWDQDVSPSGVAATWKPKNDTGTNFDARMAAYVATEVAADEDPKMWGAQGNAYIPYEDMKIQVSTSFYDWGDNQATAVAGNQGNSATTSNFLIWEAFGAVTVPGGPLDEMTGYVQVMNNLDESDNDNGIVLGGQLGSSSWKKGNYNAFLVLYSLDGDCLFSPVAQDDTPVAGTGLNDGNGDGMDGIVLGGQYFIQDNVALKVWVLTSDPENADDEPLRLRVDLDFNVK